MDLDRIRMEMEVPGDDLFGDFGDGTVVGESVGTESDQSLSNTDAELDRHHPGRLVDYEPQVGTGLKLDGDLTSRCVRLNGKDGPGGDIG